MMVAVIRPSGVTVDACGTPFAVTVTVEPGSVQAPRGHWAAFVIASDEGSAIINVGGVVSTVQPQTEVIGLPAKSFKLTTAECGPSVNGVAGCFHAIVSTVYPIVPVVEYGATTFDSLVLSTPSTSSFTENRSI